MHLKMPFKKRKGKKQEPQGMQLFADSGDTDESSISDKLKTSRLWTIATRQKPKSQRFSQVSFEGFRPKGRNRFEQALNTLNEFFAFVGKYLKRKSKYIAVNSTKLTTNSVSFTKKSKAWLTRKLIWSGGKLGRPIATGIVMLAAFAVFMFGEVLNSSRFVNSQEVSPDYVSNVTDIIPQTNTALTTIPESRKQSEPFSYVVQSGDTLSTIGNQFKISTDAIKYVNGLSNSSVLKVGQELTIPPVTGLIHTVKDGDTLDSIANKYDVAPQAVADFNYVLDTSSLAVGTELVIPNAKVPQPVIVPNPVTPSVPGVIAPPPAVIDPGASGGWCMWPTTARLVTQNFTWYHNGIDIASNASPPLYACGDGVVTRAGWDPWGLGLHVRIDHGGGYETIYGHLSRVDVGFGERVSKGQVLGIMGSTGRSTGPHVHFMVNYNGVPQNPLNYIQ